MKVAIKKLIEPILIALFKRFSKDTGPQLTTQQIKHMHSLELQSRVRGGLDYESALIQLEELRYDHMLTQCEYDKLEVFICNYAND